MLFHVIGLKCQECGSYNTCRTGDPETSTLEGAPMTNGERTAADGAEDDGAEVSGSRNSAASTSSK